MCEGNCNIKQYFIKTFHSKAAQKFALFKKYGLELRQNSSVEKTRKCLTS